LFDTDSSDKIPYLTAAEGVGVRNVVAEMNSSTSGRMYIEESVVGKDRFRRLFFQSNLNVIQSGEAIIDVVHTAYCLLTLTLTLYPIPSRG
jgi:hypothetical protein